jgi:hypothetical protein
MRRAYAPTTKATSRLAILIAVTMGLLGLGTGAANAENTYSALAAYECRTAGDAGPGSYGFVEISGPDGPIEYEFVSYTTANTEVVRHTGTAQVSGGTYVHEFTGLPDGYATMSVNGLFLISMGFGCTPTDPNDLDGDGVANARDRCPGTPAGTAVNRNGCPKPVRGGGKPVR